MQTNLISAAVNGIFLCTKALHIVCGKPQTLSQHSKARYKNNREDVITMKKSTLIAWVAFFSAIAGALAAAYFYIQRREKELEEYEQLLFSEDFCDESPDLELNVDYTAEIDEIDELDETVATDDEEINFQ